MTVRALRISKLEKRLQVNQIQPFCIFFNIAKYKADKSPTHSCAFISGTHKKPGIHLFISDGESDEEFEKRCELELEKQRGNQ